MSKKEETPETVEQVMFRKIEELEKKIAVLDSRLEQLDHYNAKQQVLASSKNRRGRIGV